MSVGIGKPVPPSDDPRWETIQARMRNYGYRPHALIEVLHAAQEQFGYLNKEALTYIASALHAPRSKVYGVATFYHLFTLKPPAPHTCVVCTGTACHIKGAEKILNAVNEFMLLDSDGSNANGSADGAANPLATDSCSISLQTTRCVGFCSPAPVVLFDEEVLSNQSPESVVQHLRDWSNHVT